jgi:hypothetical protein
MVKKMIALRREADYTPSYLLLTWAGLKSLNNVRGSVGLGSGPEEPVASVSECYPRCLLLE